GTKTGISADDRTATIRNLANNNAGRSDFVRPGHIFPLIAKDGGVLMRSGHTEAAIDLCRLAGIEPVAAICELVNDDGTVMRGPQVRDFAKRHDLRRISVADLIAYRQAREKLVTRVAEFTVPSAIGELKGYAYVTPFDKVHHYAFVYGNIGDGAEVPTRLHRANVLEDVFGGAKPIHAALSRFKAAGQGVLVYLRDGTSGVPISTIGEEAATNSGHELWVYDLRPVATAALAARGARAAESPAEVAGQCEVVFTSLPGPSEVEPAVLDPATGILVGLPSGGAFIDMTTNAPGVARRL